MRMNRRGVMLCTAGLLGVLAFSHAGSAQRGTANARITVVEHRQALMDRVGKLMKALGTSSSNGFDDLGAARQSAAALHDTASRAARTWPAGTAVGTGKSAAKPEIWTQKARFDREMAAFVSAARGVNVALAQGERSAARQHFDNLGKTCKSCHTAFKGKKP